MEIKATLVFKTKAANPEFEYYRFVFNYGQEFLEKGKWRLDEKPIGNPKYGIRVIKRLVITSRFKNYRSVNRFVAIAKTNGLILEEKKEKTVRSKEEKIAFRKNQQGNAIRDEKISD